MESALQHFRQRPPACVASVSVKREQIIGRSGACRLFFACPNLRTAKKRKTLPSALAQKTLRKRLLRRLTAHLIASLLTLAPIHSRLHKSVRPLTHVLVCLFAYSMDYLIIILLSSANLNFKTMIMSSWG